ncbi:TPA: hypothetical protein HA295_05190 [Candidatus Woesearchaeota archaeon]|nr:hypothetical protein [Candidatus Woesearchaeota archaeon]HII66143.1 hypothetical protein [Candidatus Woesearchaeota archaeon]
MAAKMGVPLSVSQALNPHYEGKSVTVFGVPEKIISVDGLPGLATVYAKLPGEDGPLHVRFLNSHPYTAPDGKSTLQEGHTRGNELVDILTRAKAEGQPIAARGLLARVQDPNLVKAGEGEGYLPIVDLKALDLELYRSGDQ